MMKMQLGPKGTSLSAMVVVTLLGAYDTIAFADYGRDGVRRRPIVRPIYPPRPGERRDLRKARQLVVEAMDAGRYGGYSGIRTAYYKFRLVRTDLSDLGYSREEQELREALEIAVEKLNDPYMSDYDKRALIADCGQVMLRNLDILIRREGGGPGHGGSLRDIRDLSKSVVRDVNRRNIGSALQTLRQMNRILRRYSDDGEIQSAMEIIDVLQEKLPDPSLSQRDKEELARDCLKSLKRHVRKSRYYNGGWEEGPGYGQVTLGYANFGARNRSQHVQVSGLNSFSSLIIRATNSGVFLKNVRVMMADGRVKDLYDVQLRAGQQTTLQLGRWGSPGRRIRSVVLVGQSTGYSRGTAQVELIGIQN